MKKKIVLGIMISLSFTEGASACIVQGDCIYPAQCVRYRGSVDGVCVGGYKQLEEETPRSGPVDIYGGVGQGLVNIINLFRSHKKPKVEPKEESHE